MQKENRVVSSLKGRNPISTYMDFTEKPVWYVLFWNKSPNKSIVCAVQQMQKA